MEMNGLPKNPPLESENIGDVVKRYTLRRDLEDALYRLTRIVSNDIQVPEHIYNILEKYFNMQYEGIEVRRAKSENATKEQKDDLLQLNTFLINK